MKILKYLLVLIVVITFWFQSHIFFDTYDAKYMHDYYSMSQWAFPFSSRVMGDGDLYSYSGYSLTNEYKPFLINPETPVFAKLMFGYSIRLFNNPHYVSIIFLIVLLLGSDQIAKNYFKFDKNKRMLLAIFIFCSAEIQEQVKDTLLDLPQIALYIWHLVYLFKIKKDSRNISKNILISGLILGFMSASKAPLYTPIILIIDTWYLYKNKSLKYIFLLVLSTISAYLLPYLPIIISDGIIKFIRSQKWVFNFYTSSLVKAPIGMIIIASFTGIKQGWTNSNWETINTWNGEWSLGIMALLLTLKEWFNKKIKSNELLVILITITTIFLLLLKIPFWPRYMIFLIPFFWMFILHLVKDKKLLILLLIFPIISTSKLVLQTYISPTNHINQWKIAAYEEIYNSFSNNLKDSISRKEFIDQNIAGYDNVQPYKIEVKLIDQSHNGNLEQLIKLKYLGIFGEKTTQRKISWIREHSQWKIDEIKNIAEVSKSFEENITAICVNPTKVQDWTSVYGKIGKYFNLTQDNGINAVMQLVPRDYCIPIGKELTTSSINNFELTHGIEIISNKL